ncbi:MAG: globin domain-containing protein [Ferruginibacter sp.]
MSLLNSAKPAKGITQEQIVMVQKTWKVFRAINPEIIGDLFYTKLFIEMPSLKRMFRNPMTFQYKKLVDMISMMIGRLHNLEEITGDIREMAKRHVGYGVQEDHYKIVGSALLWTLQQGLGKDWNTEVKNAWANCYDTFAGIMVDAAGYQ